MLIQLSQCLTRHLAPPPKKKFTIVRAMVELQLLKNWSLKDLSHNHSHPPFVFVNVIRNYNKILPSPYFFSLYPSCFPPRYEDRNTCGETLVVLRGLVFNLIFTLINFSLFRTLFYDILQIKGTNSILKLHCIFGIHRNSYHKKHHEMVLFSWITR